MRFKDYVFVADLNIKKRSNNILYIGITISICLLSIILFLMLSIKYSLNSKIDNINEISTANIQMTSVYRDSSYADRIHYDFEENLLELNGVSGYISFHQFFFTNENYSDKVMIDNETYKLDREFEFRNLTEIVEEKALYVLINVIDLNKSSSIFLNCDYDVSSSPLLCGNMFSEKSAGEIMVSSLFFDTFGMNPNDYIGKKLSFDVLAKFNDEISAPDSDAKRELYSYYLQYIKVISDFTIVGVYDKDIYKTQTRTNEAENDSFLNNSLFWITNQSFDLKNDLCVPIYDNEKYYYKNNVLTMQEYCFSNNKMFLPLGLCARLWQYDKNTIEDGYLIIQFDSYDSIWNASSKIEDYYYKSTIASGKIDITQRWTKNLYRDYSSFYSIYYFVSNCLLFLVIVSFILCLLNMFNIMLYGVKRQTRYYGMLQAIGLRKKNIFTQFFVEISMIFFKALIITFFIGSIISYGITFLCNKFIFNLMKYGFLNVSLQLHQWYFYFSFMIVFIMSYLLSILMAFLLSLNHKNKTIADTLK
ncbi:MAG: ABC transporter permease [Anaeroplasmataceae bacterium]